jgi:GntR family transcriptional regulator
MTGNKLPIHEQIRAYIYSKILSGDWPSGYQIPSERELSEQFQVSRVTVRQALINLASEGHVRRVQGLGTFVSIPKIEMVQGELISITTLMQKQGRIPETILTKLHREPLNAVNAELLGYPIGEDMYIIQRIRRANGVNVVIENTMLPYRKLPDIDKYDLVASSVFSLMADVYNYGELMVYQTIEAGVANKEVADLLGIEEKSPIVSVNRVTRDMSNEVVEYAQDFYPADRICFVYNGKINLKESQQKFRETYLPFIETNWKNK